MAHKHEDIFENRRQFQLERMILFSDAVFAIAITLLVLDLKMPEAEYNPDYQVQAAHAWDALSHITSQFIGFVFSFFIIGQYWVTHHRLFGFVSDFDSGLLWLNLLTLFFIVLVPFTTNLNFNYGTISTWVIYSLNLALVSTSIFLIWRRISNPRRKLTWLLDDPLRLKYGRIRSIVVTCIFLLGLVCLIPHMHFFSQFVFVLIFPAMKFVTYRYNEAVKKRQIYQAAHPVPKRNH